MGYTDPVRRRLRTAVALLCVAGASVALVGPEVTRRIRNLPRARTAARLRDDRRFSLDTDSSDADAFDWVINTLDGESATRKRFAGFELFVGRPGSIIAPGNFRMFGVPLWFVAMLALVYPAWSWRLLRRSRGWARTGRCVACGYDLRGSAGRCPECGTEAAK